MIRSRVRACFMCAAFALAAGMAVRADAPPTVPPLDVDQLAVRMKKNLPVYQQIRDQALATYAKLHPAASPYDKDAKQVVQLMAYLWVWGDFYREGLWKIANDDASRAVTAGANDPLLAAVPFFPKFEWKHGFDEKIALPLDTAATQLAASDYPVAFKLWCDRIDANNLVAGKMGKKPLDPAIAALLPIAVQRASADYGELIKARLDEDLLFERGVVFLHDLQADGDSLNAAYAVIDKSFEQNDPNSFVRTALKGAYFFTYAWTARGIGYADTVTDDMQKTFQERLLKADDILELAYAQHSEAGYVSREMLTVELGQGVAEDRMEEWFQRAIKANPDDFEAYRAKANYLTPKWYGSDDALWDFGAECAQAQNWSTKIPMILVDSIVSDLWKQHPEYFTDPDKWKLIEATFRGYLAQYPRSNYYRSIFARWATEGKHFDVAEEQFKILGDDWDRVVFPNKRYPEMRGMADKNSAPPQ